MLPCEPWPGLCLRSERAHGTKQQATGKARQREGDLSQAPFPHRPLFPQLNHLGPRIYTLSGKVQNWGSGRALSSPQCWPAALKSLN